MSEQQSYCTFHLGSLYLGIEVQHVQEVIRHQHTTHVPLAPSLVHGLMNLRGQIVTALDLRKRLGLEDRPAGEQPTNVVIRTSHGSVSLLVDRIGDVLEVSSNDYEAPPETLKGPTRQMIRGAYKLDNQLLLILNTQQATASAA